MRLFRWVSWFSLPLLSKELIEQSNRRRTFVIRTVYAALCYVFMFFIMWDQFGGWNTDSLALLGRGQQMFESLVGLQFFAIYAFLPGLTCGVLTAEKERDTLAMLLLTKLGPWTILFEKLLSRLMPLAMLMLLSLPLLAVAYSLGGVEPLNLVWAIWVLALSAVQLGSLAVFCSAWFRTTAGAFIGTYVIGFGIFILPAILTEMQLPFFRELGEMVSVLARATGNFSGPRGESLLIGFGPYVFYETVIRTSNWSNSPGPIPPTLLTMLGHYASIGSGLLIRTFAIWTSAFLFLLAARLVLWRRAFIQPKQRILQFFRWLDGLFHRLNQNRVTKGIVLIRDSVALPLYQPIAWRETSKKTLGTTRYLIRYLLVVEPPLLFFLLLVDSGMSRGGSSSMEASAFPNGLLWLLTTLALTVLSTGLIAGEKTKQTLDVLLATPMTTREIISQKLAAVRKLTFVLWVPLLTVLAFDAWWRFSVWSWNSTVTWQDWGWFLIQRLTPMVVYPAVITWIGFHFGLRLRNQGQALLATLGVIATWCLLPAFLHGPIDPIRQAGQEWFGEAGWALFCLVIYLIEPLREEL